MNVLPSSAAPLEVSGSEIDDVSIFPLRLVRQAEEEGEEENGDSLGWIRAPPTFSCAARTPLSCGKSMVCARVWGWW